MTRRVLRLETVGVQFFSKVRGVMSREEKSVIVLKSLNYSIVTVK